MAEMECTAKEGSWVSNASRMKMRSVPNFPSCGARIAKYTATKSKVNTRNDSYRPAPDTFVLCEHKTPNFKKNAVSKVDSQSNIHFRPSQGKFRLPSHHVQTFSKIAKPKVDTSDPAPWRHHNRDLDELTDQEGFLVNPRFKDFVESNSFQSLMELRQKFCCDGLPKLNRQHKQMHSELEKEKSKEEPIAEMS